MDSKQEDKGENGAASVVPKLKQLLDLDPYLAPHKGEIERRYVVRVWAARDNPSFELG